jgi:hypothetical protein
MAHQWENVLITEANTIREALEAINGEELRIALVVNSEQGLTGIVTDGDIRRGLLNGVNLEDSVSKVVNRDFVSADAGSPRENLIELMKFDTRWRNQSIKILYFLWREASGPAYYHLQKLAQNQCYMWAKNRSLK